MNAHSHLAKRRNLPSPSMGEGFEGGGEGWTPIKSSADRPRNCTETHGKQLSQHLPGRTRRAERAVSRSRKLSPPSSRGGAKRRDGSLEFARATDASCGLISRAGGQRLPGPLRRGSSRHGQPRRWTEAVRPSSSGVSVKPFSPSLANTVTHAPPQGTPRRS